MSTRGIWGLGKNGEFKMTYDQWDAYPMVLGRNVLAFAASFDADQLDAFFDKLTLVDYKAVPTAEETALVKRTAQLSREHKDDRFMPPEQGIERRVLEMMRGLPDFHLQMPGGDAMNYYKLFADTQGDLGFYAQIAADDSIDRFPFMDYLAYSVSGECQWIWIINLSAKAVEVWCAADDAPVRDWGIQLPIKLVRAIPIDAIDIDQVDEIAAEIWAEVYPDAADDAEEPELVFSFGPDAGPGFELDRRSDETKDGSDLR